MSSVNKAILVGRLGSDPEIRYTATGSAVANVSLATSENWKDKQSGQRTERTEWHRVVFFDRLAEVVGEYLRKGSLVYVEGKLQTRKWQDQNGQDRYTTEVVARDMTMLGGRADNAPPPAGGNYAPAPAASPAPSPSPSSQSQATATTPSADFDDDIPF